MGSGDAALLRAQEVQIGARVDETESAVDVERLCVEIEVEALRKHHLEDVTRSYELLCHLHCVHEGCTGHGALGLGELPHPSRRGGRGLDEVDERGILEGGLAERAEQVLCEGLEARLRRLVRGAQLDLCSTLGYEHVVHEHDSLEPTVERAELTDHEQDRVGKSEVVARHIGKALDLAHHVVADVAHEPAVQRRKTVERRGPELLQERAQRREQAVVHARAHLRREGHLSRRDDPGAESRERYERVAPDEGPSAPSFTALHRLEEEAGTVPGHLEEGTHGREGVGHERAPDGHDPVPGGQLPEVLRRRTTQVRDPSGAHPPPEEAPVPATPSAVAPSAIVPVAGAHVAGGPVTEPPNDR
jgi:hypothetical protein